MTSPGEEVDVERGLEVIGADKSVIDQSLGGCTNGEAACLGLFHDCSRGVVADQEVERRRNGR